MSINNQTRVGVFSPTGSLTLDDSFLTYWRRIAQSTAHGHLRAFHEVKSYISLIQYKTNACFTNVKHINIIRKLALSILLSYKKLLQIKLGDAGTIDRFGLAFQYQINKILKKRMDKNNRKLKILYKRIKANTSAIWQNMLHISPTKKIIS